MNPNLFARRVATTKRRNRGVTLIELLVTMAIAVILAMIALPSYSSIMNRNRVAGEVNQFVTALQFARSEAAKQGLNAVVCVSTDQSTCSTSSRDFIQGYIVFVDANNNGIRDSNEPILRAQSQSPGGDAAVPSNNLAAFRFNREGFLAALPANPVSIFFGAQAGADLKSSRCLMISLTGRLQVQTANNSSCT